MPKLNIIYASDYLNGYINIPPVLLEEHPDVRVGNFVNIDWIADNGELEEIVANKIIEYIPHGQLAQVISNWVSKLRIGGRLVLGFIDTPELVRMLHMDIINMGQYNTIVHGQQDAQHLFKKSSVSTQQVIDMLKPHSLKISSHTMMGLDTTIVFERTK